MAQDRFICRKGEDADVAALTCDSLVINGVTVAAGAVTLADAELLTAGSSADVTLQWDATNLLLSAAADDSLFEIGDSATPQLSFDVKIYGNAAAGADYLYFDASANLLYTTGVDLQFKDNDMLVFGSGAGATGDVQIRWDATDLDMLPTADDSVFKIGNGTLNFDVWLYGNTANGYVLFDASANTLALVGGVRPRAFNTLSPRYELKWVAGQRGKPSLNADIRSATENTREIADPDFEVLGTNASSDDSTFYVEGGIKLETDGADADQVIVLPHLTANQTGWTSITWGTDQETAWECDIKTGSAITNQTIWAGLKLTNTSATATDNEQCFFRYNPTVAAGNWQAISSIAGVDDEHDSTVAVAADTTYHLKIAIAANRTALMFINGVLVETSAALADTTDLIPYVGIQAAGEAATKHLYLRGQAISRKM